jgi:hypothetical protein
MLNFLVAIVMLSALSAGGWVQISPGTDRSRFEKYIGKYPRELLEAEPDLKRRLRALTGARYSFFMERLQTVMPIENVKGVLLARGCKAHECGSEEAIILIRLSDGKLHCAIRSEAYSSKIKTFSESPQNFPSDALKYALEN